MRPSAILTTAACACAAGTAAAQATTGDIYMGYPVLAVSAASPLDLSTIPANTISRYWLRPAVAQGNIPYHLPVLIARGTNDSLASGPKLSLSASIHGNELSGVPVVHRAFAYLNASGVVARGELNGTVIGVPQLNPQGNAMNTRTFYTAGNSGLLTNLNRIMPGAVPDEPNAELSLTDSYAANIWYGLWGNASNVDVAVDFHCLSTGSDGPLWAYADFEAPGVRRLAELAQPDIIKIDPGEPGSVETTFVEYGVPAITLEIGPAKVWRGELIDRADAFVKRLLGDLQMVSEEDAEEIPDTEAQANNAEEEQQQPEDLSASYRGTNMSYVAVSQTGWVNVTVAVLDDVTAGQEVAVLYGWFGDVIERLTSPVSGRVLQHQTDPAVDAGKSVVEIVYNATSDTEGAEVGGERKVKVRRARGGRGRLF